MCLKYSITKYQTNVATDAPNKTHALIWMTSRKARFCLRLNRRLMISAIRAKMKKIRSRRPIIDNIRELMI